MRLIYIVPILLAGCSQPAATNTTTETASVTERTVDNVATSAPAPVSSSEPLTPAEPGQPGGLPDDRTPLSEAPFAPDSAQGAADVVQTYYALIGEAKYRDAWALWGGKGAESGQSANAFAASFARYSEYHANVGGPGAINAGAGQRYVTVPVQAYARLKDGKAAYWIGRVVLHRTDVDGATAEDKKWRIKSIDLKTVPPAKAK